MTWPLLQLSLSAYLDSASFGLRSTIYHNKAHHVHRPFDVVHSYLCLLAACISSARGIQCSESSRTFCHKEPPGSPLNRKAPAVCLVMGEKKRCFYYQARVTVGICSVRWGKRPGEVPSLFQIQGSSRYFYFYLFYLSAVLELKPRSLYVEQHSPVSPLTPALFETGSH